ncbi:MAG: 5-dehydro-2-deoxygluconokinase [Spirochaetales bacterium]|nr:5-dehydro-2-deoxygluconokinase [Spirochaetales bacterium]
MTENYPEKCKRKYASIHMGRSCIDLYSNDIGKPFKDIKSFSAYVGGSPTNMSVGVRRLGLSNILLTAVGDDPVGEFVINFLRKEGVETEYIPTKVGHRTSCVLLGIEPPDRFPLVYYRDNCADNELDIDDVLKLPFKDSCVFEFAGTNLSREPSRSATIFAAECAKEIGTTVILDVDFRPDQWKDVRYFGTTIRSVFHSVDIVIGTEDEINAAMAEKAENVNVSGNQVSDARVKGNTEKNVYAILEMGPALVVEKRGKEGCRLYSLKENAVDVPGYPVKVKNILGAGDSFGAGFIYGFVQGWPLYRAARFGNACGAIVVTRHGCSVSMPTYSEVLSFIERKDKE